LFRTIEPDILLTPIANLASRHPDITISLVEFNVNRLAALLTSQMYEGRSTKTSEHVPKILINGLIY
jgi:hypothetical protein